MISNQTNAVVLTSQIWFSFLSVQLCHVSCRKLSLRKQRDSSVSQVSQLSKMQKAIIVNGWNKLQNAFFNWKWKKPNFRCRSQVTDRLPEFQLTLLNTTTLPLLHCNFPIACPVKSFVSSIPLFIGKFTGLAQSILHFTGQYCPSPNSTVHRNFMDKTEKPGPNQSWIGKIQNIHNLTNLSYFKIPFFKSRTKTPQ